MKGTVYGFGCVLCLEHNTDRQVLCLNGFAVVGCDDVLDISENGSREMLLREK